MNLTWNLDSLYTSFYSEEWKADRERLKHHIQALKEWTVLSSNDRNEPSTLIEEFLKRNNAFKSVFACLSCYLELILSADSRNTEAMDMLDDIEGEGAEVVNACVGFSKWLTAVDGLGEIVDCSPYLIEHRFYLNELLRQSKYVLSEEVEAVIARLQSTGSKAWQRLYMNSVSNVLVDVEVEGESRRLSLSELRNMAYDTNSTLRKAAYYAEWEAYRSIAEVSAASINGISGEALTIYGMRGYESPLAKVLTASRMDRETLEVMLSAIKENLPVFHTYYLKKAQRLGHPGSLPFYDIFAPINEGIKVLTYAEARDCIVDSFRTFSDELADFAQRVFDNHWIDAEPRPGKGNYGMCVDIFPLKESRIMTTFTGSYTDVGVLAHEIGHAYHSSCLSDEKMINTDYPTPIAETASIFCETIVNHELLRLAPREDGVSLLERSISDAGYFVVDFYGRYLFENQLYEKRKHGTLSVEELNELMLACMQEAYGQSIDPATIHPYMWINKVGYYMSGNEFLNFPYSFGLLFSKGLYAQYKKQGRDFVARYHTFLSATSKNNIVDAAKLMEIDVHSLQFWKDALALIAEEIEDFVNRA
ncbi:M3 family oligoendopeptidase [Paenibacillus wynnii]|uniref:M3 family oligoendopeptidase n=1 Tax=Paenibacillus wynnii TaxID=268407 RepID=UPI00278F1F9B|nr:M3 family oligoendopeptidase [Paenibacillus wynnii]MDQ0193660.1 pepF/M3 family oligoendopeptidase [Paenibacillus wynnii]